MAIWFVAVMAIFAAADAVYVAVLILRGTTGAIVPYGAAIVVAAIAGWLAYWKNIRPGSTPPPE